MTLYDFAILLIILFYTLGSIGTFWGLAGSRAKIKFYARLLIWGGFAVHTALISGLLLLYGADELSKGYFMQLLAWSILFAYVIGGRWIKSSFLSMTAAPLALLLFILSFKLDQIHGQLPSTWAELFFALHIGPMFISLGLLTLACGAGILFLHMQRKIKSKAKLSDFDMELPALESFDNVNRKAVLLGFPLYTLALAAGFIWAPMAWGNEGSWRLGGWDPKEVISLFVWFLYALLFHLRLARGWRGRKAAYMAIAIFAISLFSLVGVNFFMPTHHSFMINV